jgi:prepilin-type N-terminal cleavage/methylation domain-containing protein
MPRYDRAGRAGTFLTMMDSRDGPDGVTLIEMLVVLLLIGLAAALAAPALLRPPPKESGLRQLVSTAREAAIRRGETVHLRIGTSGEWRIEGAASAEPEVLLVGRVDPFLEQPLTMLLSPTGSCALDAVSSVNARNIQLDLLTCEVAGSTAQPSPAAR